MNEKNLMTVDELATYLSVPKQTVYSWKYLGRIPQEATIKLGRLLRFDKQAIDAWVQAKAGEGSSQDARGSA